MPATGRSYYPNTPGPLEQALAGSVADGTSVWGPLMMMSARHERQRAIDDVNETQAQQFMLGLKSAMDQAGIKAEGNLYGQGMRGGHDNAATMQAANAAGMGHFAQSDIDAARLLGNASQLAGIGKTVGEAEKAGAEGGNTPDLSQLTAGIGMPLVRSTPLGVQEHNIAAGATLGAAGINAAAKDRATQAKIDHPTNKGGGPSIKYTGTSPLGGNFEVDHIPLTGDNLEKYGGKDVRTKLAADPNSAAPDLTGQSELTPSGDSIQRDPELPHILDHVTNEAKAAGATLVGGQGNPRYGKNKKGQKVVVVDVVMPDGSHGTVETPTLRQ